MQYFIKLFWCHAIMFKKLFRKMPLVQVQVVELPFAPSIYIQRVYPHLSCDHLHLHDHKIYVQMQPLLFPHIISLLLVNIPVVRLISRHFKTLQMTFADEKSREKHQNS